MHYKFRDMVLLVFCGITGVSITRARQFARYVTISTRSLDRYFSGTSDKSPRDRKSVV